MYKYVSQSRLHLNARPYCVCQWTMKYSSTTTKTTFKEKKKAMKCWLKTQAVKMWPCTEAGFALWNFGIFLIHCVELMERIINWSYNCKGFPCLFTFPHWLKTNGASQVKDKYATLGTAQQGLQFHWNRMVLRAFLSTAARRGPPQL